MSRKTPKENKATEAPADKANKPKYGVNELVESTGLQAASVRVALRSLGVEKDEGNQYGWSTKKDFDEIVKAMKERSAKSAVAQKTSAEPEEKPAKTTARKSKGKAKG